MATFRPIALKLLKTKNIVSSKAMCSISKYREIGIIQPHMIAGFSQLYANFH